MTQSERHYYVISALDLWIVRILIPSKTYAFSFIRFSGFFFFINTYLTSIFRFVLFSWPVLYFIEFRFSSFTVVNRSRLRFAAVFPFITYYVLNKSSVANPREVAVNVRNTTLKKFDPRVIKHTTDHTFDLFTEVANIVCPPMSQSKRPRGLHTAYIISVYKVFDGDDSEKFEKHWLYWTGTGDVFERKATGKFSPPPPSYLPSLQFENSKTILHFTDFGGIRRFDDKIMCRQWISCYSYNRK